MFTKYYITYYYYYAYFYFQTVAYSRTLNRSRSKTVLTFAYYWYNVNNYVDTYNYYSVYHTYDLHYTGTNVPLVLLYCCVRKFHFVQCSFSTCINKRVFRSLLPKTRSLQHYTPSSAATTTTRTAHRCARPPRRDVAPANICVRYLRHYCTCTQRGFGRGGNTVSPKININSRRTQ